MEPGPGGESAGAKSKQARDYGRDAQFKSGKFLGELLSPTAVVVKSGAVEKALVELAKLGLLADANLY